MNLNKLIETLQEIANEHGPDLKVIMAKDPEGNGFNALAEDGFSIMQYDSEYGEIGYAKLTPELEAKGYDEEDIMEDGVPALILWP